MHLLSTLLPSLPSCSSSTSTRWRFPEFVVPHVWDIVLVVVHDLHAHLDVPVHQTHHSKVVVGVAEGVVSYGLGAWATSQNHRPRFQKCLQILVK